MGSRGWGAMRNPRTGGAMAALVAALCVLFYPHPCSSEKARGRSTLADFIKHSKKFLHIKKSLTCSQQADYYRHFKHEFYGQGGADDLLERLGSKGWPCRDSEVTGIIDVGANKGQDNEFLAETFGNKECWGRRAHVYLIEPNPKLIPVLKQRAHASKALGDVNFEVIQGAASNVSGTAHFSIHKENSELSSFSVKKTNRTISTPTFRLDAWAKERGITRIPLLKIDAEGFDPLVLQGCEGILPLVEVIVWECHRLMDQYGFRLGNTVSFLEKYGFVSYVVGKERSLVLNKPHWRNVMEKKVWQNCASFPRDSPLHIHDIIPGPCTKEMTKEENKIKAQNTKDHKKLTRGQHQ